MKLNTGNLIQNLKYYIFITNEYGKPSEENVDSFIETFGTTIYNDNFNVAIGLKSILDNLWEDIKSDLEARGLGHLANKNYGFDFYMQLAKDKVNIHNEEEIRHYIENFSMEEDTKENIVQDILNSYNIELDLDKLCEFNRENITVIHINKSNNNIDEEILIVSKTGQTTVIKSSIEELVNNTYETFNDYLRNFILHSVTDKDNTEEKCKNILNGLANTRDWKIKISDDIQIRLRQIFKKEK